MVALKAILFHTHGGSEVLEYADFPTPKPRVNEVLVRLEVAALNHLDLWVRKGWYGIKLDYPHIPGADGAGLIAAVGQGVQGWSPGDRVVINANIGCWECEYCLAGLDNQCRNWEMLGETVRGTYAEYVCLPARNVFAIPAGFDSCVAAAGALVYQTAWHSLITRGNLRPGESVAVVGVSGGVNAASIDVAKLIGATVYAVGSNQEKLAIAESLGADYLIDRSIDKDWSKAIYNLTTKRGVDVVVDNVGTTFPMSFRAARKGGRILTVGNTGGPKIEIDNRYVFSKHLSLIGSSMGTWQEFSTVMGSIYAGRLHPVLDRSYPLSEARLAQERLEKGQQMGKITLEIGTG
jgi:NADPH:quinone reductase-like Zn-dependent oxidoreductase